MLTKYQRLIVYKKIRDVLIKEQLRRKQLHINKAGYDYVNFCRIIDKIDYNIYMDELTELYKRRPTYSFHSGYWFDPLKIEPRLKLINQAISNTKVTIWDIIFRKK